jgi:Recombination endonuclease VII
MLERQGGCAICGSPDPGWTKGWHVDHDHKSGALRGLLCNRCNLMLGHAKDSAVTLQAAIDYLLKPPGFVPPDMSEAVDG